MTLKILLFDSEALTILRSCEFLPTLLMLHRLKVNALWLPRLLADFTVSRFYQNFVGNKFGLYYCRPWTQTAKNICQASSCLYSYYTYHIAVIRAAYYGSSGNN